MKKLHYPLLALVLVAIVGLPSLYALAGRSAEPVPGANSKEVLRSKSGRSYVGGGPRTGK
ncbi:hypothetical protein AB833_28765 [Chromatiales bacterium (ex Bugula neritina AB1)]|nr:hypothetical protein AB833_28765 [Chromatiales bacterium (ex Bugula neritina AB1)]